MPSIFTRIIQGEIPGRILHEDDQCFAMLDIRPLHPGHTLVIPKEEIDQWTDLSEDLAAHLMSVAHRIGRAQKRSVECERIGLMIAGLEVPHVHLHVVPINGVHDLDFANAAADPDPVAMDEAQRAIVDQLRSAGHDPGV